MTRIPQVAGGSYADIVIWRWERTHRRWISTLKDGTELRAEMQRFSGQTRWWPLVISVKKGWRGSDHYASPDGAQQAAFDRWNNYFQAQADTEHEQPAPSYPEHEKLHTVADKSQVCGEFLEWLQARYTIAEYHVHSKHCQDENGRACTGSTKELYTASINVQKLLAEFFEIDEAKLEEEKLTMLAALRGEEKK